MSNPTVLAALQRAGYTADDNFVRFVAGLSQAEAGGKATDVKGKVIKGPKTRSGEQAAGPLQIMPGTFAEVNAKSFGGKLDINNNDDLALAGVTYARQMFDRANGNIFNAAKMYHGGPGAMGKNPRDTGTGLLNNDYAAKVAKAADAPLPKQEAKPPSDIRVAAVATELANGLAPGSLAQTFDPPPRETFSPAATGQDPMSWHKMLQQRTGAAQPVQVAGGDFQTWVDQAAPEIQDAAVSHQDAMLANAFGGDAAMPRYDTTKLPGVVDRYLERILSG